MQYAGSFIRKGRPVRDFLFKNLDKITNSIVDICFDDVVVLDVVTVVTKFYEKLTKFLKKLCVKKIRSKCRF